MVLIFEITMEYIQPDTKFNHLACFLQAWLME